MGERSSLDKTPFPRILARHFEQHATGSLSATSGPFTKRIYLKEGMAIFASSNHRNDRLGEMLVRRGALALPDFLKTSSAMTPGKRFGTLLVEGGILSPAQLVWGVKRASQGNHLLLLWTSIGDLRIQHRGRWWRRGDHLDDQHA